MIRLFPVIPLTVAGLAAGLVPVFKGDGLDGWTVLAVVLLALAAAEGWRQHRLVQFARRALVVVVCGHCHREIGVTKLGREDDLFTDHYQTEHMETPR